MLFTKCYQIETSEGIVIRPKVFEALNSTAPLFTWSSALVLASFIASKSFLSSVESLSELSFLELGAGTALPSITAALLGAKRVIITDRPHEEDLQNIVVRALEANNIASIGEFRPLNWGDCSIINDTVFPIVDIIIGSDVFYSTEDFDSILFTVAALIRRNPSTVFYTTYQERRCSNTLNFLLPLNNT